MLAVLAESALRSFALGFVVWAILKLFRVRNPHIPALAWKTVLVTAFLMPLLMQWTPMPVPITGVSFSIVSIDAAAGTEVVAAPAGLDWSLALLLGYLAVTAYFLLKYLLNLGAGWALAHRARPISDSPTPNLSIRASDRIRTPATFASTILVPEDFAEWDVEKRNAVLLHESTHVRNRDFYWQAAAQLHRILFWFSPLAWWLPKQLSMLAEDLSDDAAIEGLSDRVGYAGILLNFTERHHAIPAALSMAQPGTVSQRIERILQEDHCLPRPGRLQRAGIWLALVPAVIVAAGSAPATSHEASVLPNVPQPTVPDAPPAPTPAPLPAPAPLAAPTAPPPPFPASPPAVPPTAAPPPPAQPIPTRTAPGIVHSIGLTKPDYPPESWVNREEGTLTLSLLIREDGTVEEAQVIKSSGFARLDAAAAEHATKAWTFRPALENGVPIKIWHEFKVKFSLDSYPPPDGVTEKPKT